MIYPYVTLRPRMRNAIITSNRAKCWLWILCLWSYQPPCGLNLQRDFAWTVACCRPRGLNHRCDALDLFEYFQTLGYWGLTCSRCFIFRLPALRLVFKFEQWCIDFFVQLQTLAHCRSSPDAGVSGRLHRSSLVFCFLLLKLPTCKRPILLSGR